MQILLNGLVDGIAIATMALAFSVVYLPTRIFHVASGGIYATAPFVVWASTQAGLGIVAAGAIAILAGVTLSVLCEALNHSRLEQRRASNLAHLVSSLGIFILLIQFIGLAWGSRPRVLRMGVDSVYEYRGVVLTGSQLGIACGGGFLIVSFLVWLKFGRRGLHLRGLADNPTQMALQGFNVTTLRLISFALSGLMAASMGTLVALDVGFDRNVGLHAVVLAAVSTIIGGGGSFAGPVVAGLGLGILRSAAVWFWSARWEEVITFLLLAVFLIFKPRGLTGQAKRLEEPS